MYNFTIDNLKDESFFKKLSDDIDEIEFYGRSDKAWKILIKLEKLLKENENKLDHDIKDVYYQLIAKLKFILLPGLSQDEILILFKDYLIDGLEMIDLNLIELLRTRIVLIFIDDRQEFKAKLLKIISDNTGKIFDIKMKINNNDEKSTVANWVKDYNLFIGTKGKDSLVHNEYFVKSLNFNKLSVFEKTVIKRLFNIYEYLKKSSYTMEGNEDDLIGQDINGNTIMFSNGKVINLMTENDKSKGKIKKIDTQKTDQEREDYKHEKAGKLESEFGDEIEKKAIEEEVLGKVDRSHMVARKRELNALIGQYKKGSLERKAVEDELEKISE